MQKKAPFFSIVIVSLNPGEALQKTLTSITSQSFRDYEVIVKDGGSSDGTLEYLKGLGDTIRLSVQADKGIFDAMNQAIALTSGDFVQFLNCGDTFFDEQSLKRVADGIAGDGCNHDLYFGDIHKPTARSGFSNYPRHLSRYFIFNFPICHQAWFVKWSIYQANPFSTLSRIGGDDIWFKSMVGGKKISYLKIDAVVVTYQGGGASENRTLKAESIPFRRAARKAVFSPGEYAIFSLCFRLRCLLKRIFYDTGAWRIVRKYQQWRIKNKSV